MTAPKAAPVPTPPPPKAARHQHGEDRQSKLSVPPDHDVKWDAYCPETRTWHRGFVARTMIQARIIAMREIGCGPDQIQVSMVKPDAQCAEG